MPRYRNLLVVENPATSSPGLAFLLATVARFGEDEWQDYWRALRANGVLAVDGWEEAYTQQFSGAAGSPGKRPIVVSYATSPAAEVIFAAKPLDGGADGRRRGRLLPAGRVRRHPARRAERGRRAHADRLHALGALPGRRARLDVRLPGARGRRAAAGVRRARDRARTTRSASRADEIDDEPRPLGRRVDRDRRALSAAPRRPSRSRSSRSSSPGRCRDPRAKPRRRRRRLDLPFDVLDAAARRVEIAWFTLWQATVSTGAHARRRAAARVGARALLASAAARSSRRSCSCRSCCRRSSSRRRSSPLLPDGLERTVWAILLAHVFFNVAVVVRVVGAFWAGLDPRLGTPPRRSAPGRSRRSRAVTLPLLAPALASAALDRVPLLLHVVRRRSSCSAASGYATLESEIYNQAARLFDLRTAAALALLQLAAVAVAVVVAGQARAAARGAVARRGRPAAARWAVSACSSARSSGSRTLRSSRCRSLALVVRSLRVGGRLRARPLPVARARDARAARRAVARDRRTRSSSRSARRRSRSRRDPGGRRRRAAAGARARRARDAAARRLGRDARLRLPARVRRRRRSTSARRRRSSRSRSRSSRCRSSSARSRPALRSIDAGSARRRPCSAPRRPASGARSSCRSSPGRSRVAAGLAFAVALGEFGATVFVARADWPTLPVAIFRFLGRPGRRERRHRDGALRRR